MGNLGNNSSQYVHAGIAVVTLAFAGFVYLHGGQVLAEALAVLVANHYFLAAYQSQQQTALTALLDRVMSAPSSSTELKTTPYQGG